VQRHYTWVRQSGGSANLSLYALAAKFHWNGLDCDGAIEALIVGSPNGPVSTSSDRLFEPVSPEHEL
jgi:hypothetical protein